MSNNDVSLTVTADASQAQAEIKKVEKGFDDVSKSAKKAEDAGKSAASGAKDAGDAGQAAASGLRSGILSVVLAFGPLLAAFATLKAARALVDIADQAIEADNKIARLAGRTKDVQPTISSAFTEIKNAVVLFARSVNDGTGVVGAIGRVMSEVAQVVAIFAKTLFGAGTEADRLKNQQGAVEFAQSVGKAFAFAGDVVKALASDFSALGTLVREVFIALGYTIVGFRDMIAAALHGDFAGAAAIWEEMGVKGEAASERIGNAFGAAVEETTRAFRHQGAAYSAYVESLANGTRIDLSSPEKPKDDHNKTLIREMDAYSDALDKQIAKLRERASVTQQMIGVEIDSVRNAALAKVDADEQAAKFALQNKQITNEQYLALEQQFEDRRYAIKQAALQNELILNEASGDNPVTAARIKEQLLELERQYQLKKAEIAQKVAQEAKGGPLGDVFGNLAGRFSQALAQMAAAGKSFGQAMASLWQGIRNSVAHSIAGQLREMAMMAIKERSMSLTKIGGDAAKAASGAYSALAGIPYVGPVLAPAAAATAFAAVMAFGSGIKSAAGGFDIPSGLNPVTQLHAEEMVLPADIANPLRDSLGGGRGSGDVNINVQAAPIGDFFLIHRRELAAALKTARREFAF